MHKSKDFQKLGRLHGGITLFGENGRPVQNLSESALIHCRSFTSRKSIGIANIEALSPEKSIENLFCTHSPSRAAVCDPPRRRDKSAFPSVRLAH